MSRPLYLNGVILDGSSADFSAYTKLSVPVNTSADAPTRRDYVDAQILEQKERIDGILSGAGVSLDNLKEISDYVNSLDETQRLDILTKVAELNATITANKEASELRDANLRSDLELEAAARASAVTAEANRATAAEQLVQSNLNTLSALEDKHYKQQTYLNEVEQRVRNVASVYADGSPALVPDASLLGEMGWFYKKSAAAGNKKHNWYLPVPEGLKIKHLKSLSLYAKIQTTDPLQRDGELPFFGVYTARLGDGKDRASWYRSRITWSGDMNNSDYQGKKVMRVKLDATREHINNGDYSPVEYTLAFNTLYSTDSSSLADVGEESVALLHISSNSSALAHQEYFVHSLKIQLEAHTHSYILDGANVDLEKRVADVQSNLNTDKAALEAADATEATARLAGDLAEATARVDAIQQEASARQAAIEAEANARAIKDGEQDAALAAEINNRIIANQIEMAGRLAGAANEKAARIAADEGESAARIAADQAELDARVAADNAIIINQNNHKEAADLTAERLAQLYLYFNQTYESVVAHNTPAISYDVTAQSFHAPDVYNPIDNANEYNYEGYLSHTIFCTFTTRALEPSNGYRYGYKISYALASDQSTEYVVWNDAPAEGNGLNIPIGTLPELQLKSNTDYVAIITLIDRDTKAELTNLQPKQVFTYTTPGSILLHPNGKTLRAIGTEDDLNLASASPSAQEKPMFFQANPRGTGMEWFAVMHRSVDSRYGGMHVSESIRYLEYYKDGVQPSSNRDNVVAAFTPPGESQPVPTRNVIMSLRTSIHRFGSFTLNPDIESWDVYNVRNFSSLFSQGGRDWNQNINHWSVTRGRNFSYIFTNEQNSDNVRIFNQPLNNWSPVRATDIRNMFLNNSFYGNTYQQNLSSWRFNNFETTLQYLPIHESFSGFAKENIPSQIAATMP
jgi:hypothetical protein